MGDERIAAVLGERAQFLPVAETAPTGLPLAPRHAPVEVLRPQIPAGPWAAGSWHALSLRLSRELSRDAARGGAFLCVPVLLAAGAALYFALPGEPGVTALSTAIALFTVVTYLSRSRSAVSFASGALLVFALGMGAAKLQTWRAATPMLGSEITTRVIGRLVRLEHQASGRVRLTIDIERTERPELSYAPDRVRLTARAVPAGLLPGDGVSGIARLMPPAGPVRPGAYDFAFASYFQGLGAVGFFMKGPERADLAEPQPVSARPARWLETARVALADRIRSQVGVRRVRWRWR